MRIRASTTALSLLLVAPGLWAGSAPLAAMQGEPLVEDRIPEDVAAAIVDFYNDGATLRLAGPQRVAAGRSIVGDIAVLGGSLVVEGTVQGAVVVVNGDLRVAEGGRVEGDVVVVGGDAFGWQNGGVSGAVAVYRSRLRYRRSGDRIALRASEPVTERLPDALRFGRARLSVRSEDAYNRVEGLPLLFGPILETAGERRFRLEAFAIWRSDNGFDPGDDDDFGFRVRAEQRLTRDGGLRLGVEARSQITPIESWKVRDVETSLSTFLFREDMRDWVEREGWGAYLRYRSTAHGVGFGLAYRDDDFGFVEPGSPLTLRDNEAAWRPQPRVARGSLRTLEGSISYDTRNDEDDPTWGWLLRARLTTGLGGDLATPGEALVPPAGTLPPEGEGPALETATDFTHAFVDLRRYLRLGPSSEVGVRGVFAGSLRDEALPAQFQHALGGQGTLPGLDRFALSCAARDGLIPLRVGDRVVEALPGYGCDRVWLLQLEVRQYADLDWEVGGGDDGPLVTFNPSWVAFADVGAGESFTTVDEGFAGSDTRVAVDVGLGVYLGSLGVYWALPVRGGSGSRVILRLGRRF
ncbi:MAG: hypothetical protein D6701_07120 [Gemmatimonadetes bacterium]|nr:MAG: hypothetical protein D6701_07120 [Gemmatimonadota bacterium]